MFEVIHPAAGHLPALRVHSPCVDRVDLWPMVQLRRGQPHTQNQGPEERAEEAISGELGLYPWLAQVGLAQARSVHCHDENLHHWEEH